MKNELLLPVGNMQMCLAAIHHGADAVYFGVPFFNARGRTTDFSLAELKEMIDLCHLYGVKTNLAFNVVIFQHEFPKVIELLKEILPMGPDAFIVQDLGLAKLIREMAPEQRIHASTQMTVTNPDAIKLLDDLKIDRFVLGRENSISDIKLIRAQTDKELEVFVHGALCVAYSGQCFTSESLGGRSANRGQCAQSCRLEYELYVDDKKKEMGEKKYLVSPKDLMGISEIGELKELGINSFKVEGRLKTPEYVAAAARNYREVIDGGALNLSSRAKALSSTYSRGFFSGWLHGVDHQRLVDGTYSAHRGLHVGKIKEVRKKSIVVESSVELKAGQGLLIAGKEEMGSKIFAAFKFGKDFEVELMQKNLALEKGQAIYLNSDEALDKELQKGWQSREFMKRIPIKLIVQGMYNEPILVKAVDPEGREAYAQTISFMAPAKNRSITEADLKEELSALGNSVYELASFECFIQDGCFMNHREIKDLRKELVEKLNLLRTAPVKRILNEVNLIPSERHSGETRLSVLLRTKEQVEGFAEAYHSNYFAAFSGKLKSIVLDFEFGKDYASSVELIQKLRLPVGIATTRILKPNEYHNLKLIARLKPDLILARNLGAIEYLKRETSIPLIGDFSLNVTNSFSAQYLIEKGLNSVNASYDLNQEQLLELTSKMDPSKLEVTLHQYMPEFHMEHCVFAAFLSNGSSFRDCGKPCERHEVKLKDPYGNWHYLKADHECRNTFYKATPQSASFLIEELQRQGVGAVRIEALSETSETFNQKILVYLKLLSGEISTAQALNELKLFEGYGLGTGQWQNRDEYKDRKKGTLTT